jgi:glycosyltransferase involved in cell wall biosynthesis
VRILHVYSGNLYGGIESILATIARRATGPVEHEFALCFDGRLSAELEKAGAAVHRLGPVSMRRPRSVAAARRALGALIRRASFDRAICHAPWSQGLFGGVIRRAGCPLVFWAHDVMSGRHWTERLAGRATPDLAICNSHFTRRSLGKLYDDVPAAVVYAPVELPLAADDDLRRRVRASLETPPDSVVIVQACRSEAWKGHEQLLDALAALRGVPGWIWWQVGGAQRPRERAFLARLRERAVRAGIGDRIRWLGERSDVGQLLMTANLYCQPNLEPEPFGIVFVEALGAGLPVVTTRHGAAEEILDSTCGVLVPPRQPAALAETLRELVSDGPRRHRLAAGSRARAQYLCDPARQIERLSAALTDMSLVPVSA